jgi:hypothetical protein
MTWGWFTRPDNVAGTRGAPPGEMMRFPGRKFNAQINDHRRNKTRLTGTDNNFFAGIDIAIFYRNCLVCGFLEGNDFLAIEDVDTVFLDTYRRPCKIVGVFFSGRHCRTSVDEGEKTPLVMEI